MCVDEQKLDKFDYRPLVGYLTETIDTCISKASRQAVDGEAVCPKSELERMDSAMLALENTIQMILTDLEKQQQEADNKAASSRQPENLDWLSGVFPDNKAGRELRASFYAIHTEE